MMSKDEIKAICSRSFSTHKAELIQNTERYLIIDWRHSDGSNNYYVNYIVDKERGSLIVSGDLGDSIAVWYNPINPANLKGYIRDIRYYVSKIQCATNLYTYDSDEVFDEIKDCLDEEKVQEFVESENNFIFDCVDNFWSHIREAVDESVNGNEFYPTDELCNIVGQIDCDYWEWLGDCGKRISMRVYLWAYGFQRACEQLGI